MAAPFRVGRQIVRVQPAFQQAAPAQDKPAPLEDYMKRLVLLIPAEVVGIYLVGIGVIPPNALRPLIVWAAVCLGLVVIVRAWGTRDAANNLSVQWTAVMVSVVSFAIWVYTIPGPLQSFGLGVPYVGSLAVLVWTFIVPYFYRG